jgi:ribosome-associated protein
MAPGIHSREAHGVMRRAAALGRAARVEDLKTFRALVEGQVRVAEDHRVGVREAAAKTCEPALCRPRVVDHADSGASRFDDGLARQAPPQTGRVHVAVHRAEGWAKRLDRHEYLFAYEIPRVDDQVGAAHQLERAPGHRAWPARHVRVGQDRYQHRRESVTARPPGWIYGRCSPFARRALTTVDDPIRITTDVSIPMAEIELRASRSSGPGGQHANVTASRVEASFDVAASPSLTEEQKQRVIERAGARITAVAQDSRSQARNRELALERLRRRLAAALAVPRTRRPTERPQAAEERRLQEKRQRAKRKRARRPPTAEES